jgi:hypothetical protein
MLAYLKGWRTVIINGVVAVASVAVTVVEAIDPESLRPYLPENKLWIVGALAITNIVLRAITNSPIGTKP